MKIGKVDIKNRFIVSPMVMNYCTGDGMATEKYMAYHEEKAKGGWGLIITENYAVAPNGKGYPYIPGLWKDEQIPGHAEMVKRVHKHGAKIFAQIYHAGRQTQERIIGSQPVAPSKIPCPVKKEIPRELTVAGIRDIVGQFGDAALRAKKAGFDGVQIHGGHGYIVSQFLSSYSNKRTDEYGGCFSSRVRFAVELVRDIRDKCGPDFGLDFKISGEEAVPEGMTIEDTKAVAVLLEEAGVDSINASIGVYASWYTQVQPAVMGHGWISDYAAELKKVVNIPVTTVGRVNDPVFAETIIAGGKADAVYMGRASLADPHLPNKAKAGELQSIIRCTACLQGCTTRIDLDLPAQCVVNPLTGRESEYDLSPAAKKKDVWVVGGGPAGAEAAIVAAGKGHNVTLFEEKDRLGGMFYTASIPPYKGEISTFLAWQNHALKERGVKICLNTLVDADAIRRGKPDTVIVATGSTPARPPIPGIDNDFVRDAVDLLNGEFNAVGNVAVIGGGLVGAETANYLATHGNSVAIFEMLEDVAMEEPANMKHFLKKSFKENDVKIHVNTRVSSINDDGAITYEHPEDGRRTSKKYDMVLLAAGMKARNDLSDRLAGADVRVVGDAQKAGNALTAIQDAYETALAL